jgi:hypothetical protein
MPKKYDAEARAKAIRLVQEPAGDYASEYATVVRKQRWWDGRPRFWWKGDAAQHQRQESRRPTWRRVAAPRAMFMRCSPFRLLPWRSFRSRPPAAGRPDKILRDYWALRYALTVFLAQLLFRCSYVLSRACSGAMIGTRIR